MLTNSEFGQANIFLATCYALMGTSPDVEIHLASFAPIEAAVTAASEAGVKAHPSASPITFHEIHGTNYFKALLSPEVGGKRLFEIAPSFRTMPAVLRIIARAAMPYTGPEMVENCNEIRRIIEEVEPDLTLVDNMFTPGLTMARHMGIKWMILSPNTLKDLALPLQPKAAFFWKYPCVGTALPFPIPWHLIPLNVLYVLILIFFMIFNSHARKARDYVTEKTGARVFDQQEFSNPQSNLKMLIASSPEFDFPVDFKPDNIIPCGPIMRPVPAVEKVDPELHTWLARGPTVFINLGSLSWTTQDQAVEMARAIFSLFAGWRDEGKDGRLQVLWKLRQTNDGRNEYDVYEKGRLLDIILGSEFDNDTVRVVNWVDAEPYAVLKTGNIICSVNHGGANSFWEALCTGVPQVVLPVWADTYDFAQRVEYLGIGKWGSPTTAPRYRAQELRDALTQVITGRSAVRFQLRSKELAKQRLQLGEGRDLAVRHIVENI
ncbi:udp-glucoronosyl and udp-glucosyl transferase family protein [Colletotrichum kahawae]|uniref:Udp-glucoronosyl and udp-glucosyl transferase family protein n=1 Tax=Colletotrichum kahawae TaxID=34407 RepID=A0AAD9YT83_COLKA|nr:udp-glucoronosyl and udp-glucosyl transferase family protein [Colletotrichum kahawae]